jgi:hypothetical protein
MVPRTGDDEKAAAALMRDSLSCARTVSVQTARGATIGIHQE